MMATIPLHDIAASHVGPDDPTVQRYADDMRRGDRFPPVRLFRQNMAFRISDGNHRVAAARVLGLQTIEADIEWPRRQPRDRPRIITVFDGAPPGARCSRCRAPAVCRATEGQAVRVLCRLCRDAVTRSRRR
jgi:hypothetical protein